MSNSKASDTATANTSKSVADATNVDVETSRNSQTQSTPIPTPKFTAQDALRTLEFDLGWSGGRANNENSPNVSFYPVTQTTVNDDVVMSYAWKDGVLKLKVSGNDLTGTWHQSNGTGPISLRFADDFQSAKGSWSDSNTGESGVAFLRRKQKRTTGVENVPTTRELQERLQKESESLHESGRRL